MLSLSEHRSNTMSMIVNVTYYNANTTDRAEMPNVSKYAMGALAQFYKVQ